MNRLTSSVDELIGSQRELLPGLHRSHRLVVAHFFASFLMVPFWFLWVIFFAAAIAESFQWFLVITAPTWLAMPAVLFSFWSGGKALVVYLRYAKRFLNSAETDINASRTAENFTTYMNLLFPVLVPTQPATGKTPTQEHQRIRRIVWFLRISPIVDVGLLIIVTFSFVSFFIRRPYVLSQLLLTPIIPYLWFNIAFWVVRIAIFLRWRQCIGRWARLYYALTTWQANLESAIQQSSDVSRRTV